jgi:hypothetical protein
MNLSGASILLTAHHFDAELSEGWHEHTWKVTAWWAASPWRDGRAMAAALRAALEAMVSIDDEGRRVIPAALWSNEALARALRPLANIEKITIDREPAGDQPGFHTEVWT